MERFVFTLAAALVAFPSSALSADAGRHNDFDGNGRSDLLWRNAGTGSNVIWRGGTNTDLLPVLSVTDPDWLIAGTGDFNGDQQADILWRNRKTGAMVLWWGASGAQPGVVSFDWGAQLEDPNWQVAAIGDFDGDRRSDILWRNRISGDNAVGFLVSNGFESDFWYAYSSNPVPNFAWKVAGTGDFDGDGRSEVLWRNTANGANSVWRFTDTSSNTAFNGSPLPSVNVSWRIAGIGDFNGDGKSDIFWRNASNGANALWYSGQYTTSKALVAVTDMHWQVTATGDFDGDGRCDLFWRNSSTGANIIWRSANAGTRMAVTGVAHTAWTTVM